MVSAHETSSPNRGDEDSRGVLSLRLSIHVPDRAKQFSMSVAFKNKRLWGGVFAKEFCKNY